MKVVARKYIRISDDNYARHGTYFKKVDGKKISIRGFEDYDFFLLKVKKGRLTLWTIQESITGAKIGKSYLDIVKAKRGVEEILKSKTVLGFVTKIHELVDGLYLPPNHKFVNTSKKLRYVATKKNTNQSLDDALRNRVRAYKK